MNFKNMKIGRTTVLAYASVKEKLVQANGLLDYLPNGVSAWEEAHGGDKSLAKQNEKKCKQASQLLGEIITSLKDGVTYHVYGLDKPYSFTTADELIKKLKELGIKNTGNERSTNIKPELANQPKFDKLAGPMYDGPGKARYDTWELYEKLSR